MKKGDKVGLALCVVIIGITAGALYVCNERNLFQNSQKSAAEEPEGTTPPGQELKETPNVYRVGDQIPLEAIGASGWTLQLDRCIVAPYTMVGWSTAAYEPQKDRKVVTIFYHYTNVGVAPDSIPWVDWGQMVTEKKGWRFEPTTSYRYWPRGQVYWVDLKEYEIWNPPGLSDSTPSELWPEERSSTYREVYEIPADDLPANVSISRWRGGTLVIRLIDQLIYTP